MLTSRTIFSTALRTRGKAAGVPSGGLRSRGGPSDGKTAKRVSEEGQAASGRDGRAGGRRTGQSGRRTCPSLVFPGAKDDATCPCRVRGRCEDVPTSPGPLDRGISRVGRETSRTTKLTARRVLQHKASGRRSLSDRKHKDWRFISVGSCEDRG